MKFAYALSFVWHDQGHLAHWVLCGDAGWAISRVTGLRLDATQGKHKTTRTIAPICAQGQYPCHVKSAHNFAAGTEFDVIAQACPHQGVVNQTQAFLQRHAQVVRKFQGRSTGAALCTIDHDEVWADASFFHGFDHAKPFPSMANAQLHADGFAIAQGAQPLHKLHQFFGG